MKITARLPARRTQPPTFTIRDVDRDTLSLIVTFAREAIESREQVEPYGGLLQTLAVIDDYVHGDEEELRKPLIIA